jgi:uncharacterized membrane protein YfcA
VYSAPLELSLVFIGSFLAALLGGMAGLVLGSLRLPVILLASGSPAAAAGTNIAVSAASALVGAATHVRHGRVDWRVAAWMTPPSVVGAFLGGYSSGVVSERILLAVIAAVLAWSGVDLVVDLRAPRTARRPLVAAAVSGGFVGLLGGAVGLILGTLRMPALLGPVGLTAHRAVGTNLVVGFFLGGAGFLGHVARLEVEWVVLAVSLAAALPGGWLGARLSGRLSAEALRRAIGAMLLAVAAVLAVSAAV